MLQTYFLLLAIIVSSVLLYLPIVTNADNINCTSNPCYGTSEADFISNSESIARQILGRGGDDLILGGNGFDFIFGDEGNDIIYGGPGDDAVSGGQGDDKIEGGPGRDTLAGNRENDDIAGGEGDDELWGDGETEHIMRYAGSDKLYGGEGNDFIDHAGGERDFRDFKRDVIDCGSGFDRANIRTSDGDFASFCERIINRDG